MRYYRCTIGLIRSEKELPYTEITQEEYEAESAIAEVKREYVQKLYNGIIAEDDIPEKYRANVIAEVEAIREAEQSPADDSVSIEVALSVLLGGAEL